MKDNLNMVSDYKKTILYLDKIVSNFPSNERVLKDKINNILYDLLEVIYMALDFKEKRLKYLKIAIVKVKMIDFYLKISCDKKYISYKKYKKVSGHLLDLLRQVYGWLKNEKSR